MQLQCYWESEVGSPPVLQRSGEAVSDMSAETQVEQDAVKRENECDEDS